MAAAGRMVVPKPGGVAGDEKSGLWTSVASKYSRKLFGGTNTKFLGIKAAGKLVGKIIPEVGWAILGYDAVSIAVCTEG